MTSKNSKDAAYPAPPRTPRPYAGPTTEAEIGVLAEAGEQISGIRVSQGHLSRATWTEWLRFDSSILSDFSLDTLEAPDCFMTDVHWRGANIVSLDSSKSGWRNVVVEGCRIGAGELYEASWNGIHFVDCKINYLNLRRARLVDVRFTRCTLGEVDLTDGSAKRCAFEDSQIDVFSSLRAKFESVDLRGATIGSVPHVQGLRGAVLTQSQILDLAPAMARQLGIDIF